MAENLEERLVAAYGARREKRWVARRLGDARAERERVATRLAAIAGLLALERHDVDRLEGVGGFFRALFAGRSDLQREQRELAAAQLQHDELADELAAIEVDVEQLEARALAVQNADADYAGALAEKEARHAAHGGPFTERLAAIAEQEGQLRSGRREVEEAIAAGQAAHDDLVALQISLPSFSSSILDLPAFWTARRQMATAQQRLTRFQRECADVRLEGATELVELPPLPGVAKILVHELLWDTGDVLVDVQAVLSQILSGLTDAVRELRARARQLDGGLEQLMDQRALLLDPRPERL